MANDIVLHQVQSVQVGLRQKDGYVNATAMAAAHQAKTGKRKDVSNWLKTAKTQEDLAQLSSVTGIPVTELYQVFQGGSPENQGTWIHPRLAVRFGMWLSSEFGLAVENWVDSWAQNKHRNPYPENFAGKIERTPEEAALFLLKTAISTGFSRLAPEIQEGMFVEGAIALYPQLRPALEPFKPKLLVERPLLSPTQLGEILEQRTGQKHSPRQINTMLVAADLQQSTGHKNPAWEPIGRGLEYGQVIADTAKGHGKTVQSTRWYESVLEQLLP
jgi:hypothetical protein